MERWTFVLAAAVAFLIYWFLRIAPSEPRVRPWNPVETPANWGKIVDPDSKSKLTWDGRNMAFDMPGGVFELQGIGPKNAPRVLRKFNGDFAIEVNLSGDWNPKSSQIPGFYPYHGAGPLVWIGESTFLRLERAVILLPDGRKFAYVHFERHEPTGAAPVANVSIPDDAFPKLAVERQGNDFIAYMDGRRIGWTQIKAPAEIEAGVAAVNNTTEPLKFEVKDVQFFRN